MVGSVAHVYHSLRPEDEKRAAIFAKLLRGWEPIDFFRAKARVATHHFRTSELFSRDLAIGLAKSFWCSHE